MRSIKLQTLLLAFSLVGVGFAVPAASAAGCVGFGQTTDKVEQCLGWHWGGAKGTECIGKYDNTSENECQGIDP